MGVTGLWDVVKPVARPVKLETLNRKRLAVDASIWIYQFLKAVRDKEGNALRNSHVVGFFRRICKLLYFGIKPVFVFDGGAPILKRQTISGRKARREGKREDVVRTAGKLLAKQMQHRAEEDARKRREARNREPEQEELPEELVYVEEQMMTPAQKQQNRQFKKKDAYHLPDLDVSLNEMGAPNDPRIMSQEELEEYARQFNEGEDINLYDFSKIDFDGPFFTSLPASDRYNILNAARLRSRLRMGYSKEQLDVMFPNRMAFSKFQIERVKERNELTQRLMNLNGMNPEDFGLGRVAGEKGKEYVLVRNEGAEGGWALGVVSSNKDEGRQNKPIDIDRTELPPIPADDSDADSFEDVPIEGLNRLPKRPKLQSQPSADPAYSGDIDMQQALLADSNGTTAKQVHGDDDDLFVPAAQAASDGNNDDELFEDVLPASEMIDADDEELQKAIALSMQPGSDDEDLQKHQKTGEMARNERLRRETALGFSKTNRASGRQFANYANARAAKTAPRAVVGAEDTNPELRAAFEAGRKMGPRKKVQQTTEPAAKPAEEPSALVEPNQFKGPLPFESIDLGKSIFSKFNKKKADPELEEGGFEKKKEDKPKTPPPWFGGESEEVDYRQSHIKLSTEATDQDAVHRQAPVLKHTTTGEIIDLDGEDTKGAEPIDLLSSEDESELTVGDNRAIDPDIRMGDIADLARAEPPVTEVAQNAISTGMSAAEDSLSKPSSIPASKAMSTHSAEGEDFQWEESDYEDVIQDTELANPEPAIASKVDSENEDANMNESSPEPEFEDVALSNTATQLPLAAPALDKTRLNAEEVPQVQAERSPSGDEDETDIYMDSTVPLGEEPLPTTDGQFEDDFSDPEDEQLMQQLAEEAEEHARFAAQLNIATGLQSAADYEKELKQLRNQQKAERRDADEVTQVMITECQQLLRLFGLPYITAPMEAEAQCAELYRLGLVDGIVTDDSDIFLFGGTRIYKNMFSQAKEVQFYLFGDLEKEYGLTREKIIQIAHLLGSDYTEGIPNVGPVTALEIMTEFGDLQSFEEWWTSVQTGMAPQEAKGFKKKFRKNATKIFLPPGFPDPRVDQAYLKPEVDSDASEFQWGVPDLEALRQFLMATIGWSPDRTDEILVPVIKDINRREAEGTQANITRFYRGGVGDGPAAVGTEAYAPRRRQDGKSTRMETALGKLHEQTRKAAGGDVSGEQPDATGEAEAEAQSQSSKKAPKKRKTTKSGKAKEVPTPEGDKQEDSSDSDEFRPEKSRKTTKRRKARKE